MDDKYLGGFLSVLLLYIIVIAMVIVDNIYISEIYMYLIHVGTATSIILIIISLVLSIDSKQQESSIQSITIEPAEETKSEEDEDEVIELGILEEFKEDYSEDKKP